MISESPLKNIDFTCFLGRLFFLAFLTPELLLFFAWNLFLSFEFTWVFPGAMFLRNISEQHRWSQGLLCHNAAIASGNLRPKSLPLHLRITSPAIFDCLRGTWSHFTTLFPSSEGGVWSKFFDQVSEDQVDGICFSWPFFRTAFGGACFLGEAEEGI